MLGNICGKYFSQQKIIDPKVLPELSWLSPAAPEFAPLADASCVHIAYGVRSMAKPIFAPQGWASFPTYTSTDTWMHQQNSFALDYSAHAPHNPSWVPQQPGPQILKDTCKTPPMLFPFLNHPSCLKAVMDQPLCQICCPTSRQLSEDCVGFLCWIFHPALLWQPSKEELEVFLTAPFHTITIFTSVGCSQHLDPCNYPFLFQPCSTTVGQQGLGLWLLTTWKQKNCQIHPRRKTSKDIYTKRKASLFWRARHLMMLAPAFYSHHLPYLASFHPALPSHWAKREWHLPSEGIDEMNLLTE